MSSSFFLEKTRPATRGTRQSYNYFLGEGSVKVLIKVRNLYQSSYTAPDLDPVSIDPHQTTGSYKKNEKK